MGKIEERIKQNKQQEQHTPRENTNNQQPNISKELQHIRETSLLTQAMKKHPQINKWLTEDYTEKDVEATIRQLKNHKSHGQDGIPGETYKSLNPWIAKPQPIILNKIKNRDKLLQNGRKEQWYIYTKTRAMRTNARTIDQYA